MNKNHHFFMLSYDKATKQHHGRKVANPNSNFVGYILLKWLSKCCQSFLLVR